MADSPAAAVGGTSFTVTPAEIAAAASSATSTANSIADQLAAIRSYVVGLEEVWRGIAAGTFQSLMNDYDVFAKMLNQALTDIGSGLNGNFVNYSASEQQNINNLQKVNGAIPGANFA